jgi:hypothetical protein
VIPLRPIALGEILDGSFTSVRRNPVATLGIAAIVLTAFGVIVTALEAVLSHYANPLNIPGPGPISQAQVARLGSDVGSYLLTVLLPTVTVAVFLGFAAWIILTGVLTTVIGRGVLGHRITLGEAWRIALPRLPALLGALWLMVAVLAVPWGALVLVGFVLVSAGAPAGALAALLVIGSLGLICLSIWFSVMFSMFAPAVVLERQGPFRALARSWRLVRRSFWRVFGILLLGSIITAIVGSILRFPFEIIGGVTGGFGGFGGFTPDFQPSILGLIISAVGLIVAGTVTYPISAGITVLLYVDLRMRREGLDLVLQTVSGQPSPDEFSTLWRPVGSGPTGAPGSRGPAGGPAPPAAATPPAW